MYFTTTAPEAEPVITTPVEVTDAIAPPELIDHVPPDVVVASESRKPTQTLCEPVIAAGNGSTVMLVLIEQPVAVEVNVIDAVLALVTPVEPKTVAVVVEPVTVATPVALLAHVPGVVDSVNVIEPPAHTDVGPPIAPGNGLTVNGLVIVQPKVLEV